MLIDTDGRHWIRCDFKRIRKHRPALFLDRDGVIVEEVGYLRRVSDVRLTPGIGEAIAAANRANVSVHVVTNQSGVGRGLFDWPRFEEIETEIAALLAAHGARLDSVLACGAPPARDGESEDPWRKPAPGMILKVRELVEPDLARSWIVGDRMSDILAGEQAGLAGGFLVPTRYGSAEAEAKGLGSTPPVAAERPPRHAESAAAAIRAFLDIVAS